MERIKMSRVNRAKQFAPFEALKGLGEALRLKEFEHEKGLKKELQEEQIVEISKVLSSIKRGDLCEIVFFEDGYEREIIGHAQVFIEDHIIKIDKKKISFENIQNISMLTKKEVH